jgi:hypothetical protein
MLGFKNNSNYRKPEIGLLRLADGKLRKPKHNFKVHLFGGISSQGLTPLIIFTGIYRFFMDKGPKHTSHSSRRFIILNNINHFETPTQSPDLMPIEMVF